MSQQINLYNPVSRDKGTSFTSAKAMCYGVGVAIAAAALAGGYQNYRLRETQAQAQSVAQAHKDATARRDKLTAAAAQLKPNTQLEQEIAALDAQLQERQEIMATLSGNSLGSTGGFSDYMLAFSRQKIDGLWLTAFDIAGSALAIQGRTINGDLVAEYLKQLNQEKALQGRQFAALRIVQPPPEQKTEKAAPGQKEAPEQKPVAPRFLEFTLSTLDISDSASSAATAGAGASPLLGVITTSSVLDTPRSTANAAADTANAGGAAAGAR